MADQVLETLVLKLVADSEGIRGDMQKMLASVDKTSKGMEQRFEGVGKAMASLKAAALGLAAAVGVTLSVGAFGNMIAQSMKVIDVQAKMADRLELTTDEYAALELAANLAGTSIESVASASNFLKRQIDAASKGNEEAIARFKELGVTAQQLKDMRLDQAIGVVSDKLYEMNDANARTALSMSLLGRGSSELDAFMRDGSAGIELARKAVEDMGGALTRLDMQAVEEANDTWTLMETAVTRVKDEMAVQLAPAITMVLQEMLGLTTTTVKEMGGIREAVHKTLMEVYMFADGWVRTAQTIGGFLSNLVTAIVANFKSVPDSIGATWAGLKLIVANFVEFSGQQMAALLHQSAEVAGAFDADVATKIREAAFAIGRTTNTAALDAAKNFDQASAKAVVSAQVARDAWSNILNIDSSGSKFIQDLMAKANQSMMAPAQAPGGESKGAGAGTSPAVTKATEEAAQKLEILRKSLLTERELEVQNFIEKTEFLNALKDEQFEVEGERNVLLQDLEAQHQSRLTEIDQKAGEERARLAQKTMKMQLDGASTFFSNMSSLMNTNSKKLFAIGKAAAMATTIVNTASAAMGAYNFGAQQGGPYLGAAYAAAAIAAGAVQLANISSASPGGGGSVSGGGGGVPSTTGQDPNSPNVGVDKQRTQDMNITINGTGISKEQLIDLAEQLNQLRGDGVALGNVTVQ